MNIHIVEDNKSILNDIAEYVKEYILAHRLDCALQKIDGQFSRVLDSIDPNEQNIYFLDIMLGEKENGLQLAQKIRSIDIHGYIVFITSYMEFAFPAIQYKIRALDYILKNDKELKQKVFACLDTARDELHDSPRDGKESTIVIRTAGTHFIIPTAEIIFFETNTHKRTILLHTKDKTIEFRDTLDDLQSRLDKSFYRCHRSFMINLNHVKSVSKKRGDMHVVLSHGFKCLISARYLRGLLRYERDSL